jgi:hypothetical protein
MEETKFAENMMCGGIIVVLVDLLVDGCDDFLVGVRLHGLVDDWDHLTIPDGPEGAVILYRRRTFNNAEQL